MVSNEYHDLQEPPPWVYEVKGKQVSALKWMSLRPLILQSTSASILFIGVPIILFTTHLVNITVDDRYVSPGVIAFAGICGYFYVIAAYFIPGVYSLFDLLTDNFVTCKMTYVMSYIDRSRFLAFNRATSTVGRIELLKEHCYMRVLLADHKGKSLYSVSLCHLMEEGGRYIVQYGKFSKVIVSILSEQGQGLLLCDVR